MEKELTTTKSLPMQMMYQTATTLNDSPIKTPKDYLKSQKPTDHP